MLSFDTDPNETSTRAGEIGWSGDIGVELKPDPEKYPDGQAIEVRAAAFQDGQRSDVVRQIYVFASPLQSHTYKTGTYAGTSGDLSVTVTVDDPRYTGTGYITNILLDATHQQAYAAFLPDLLSRIYLAQETAGVAAIAGHEAENEKIFEAVRAALEDAVLPAEPILTVTPNLTSHANDAQIEVALDCKTEGAEIYYTLDNSNTMSGNMLSDPTKNGTLYEGPFSVNVDNPAGGTVYVRAAAKSGGAWSSIVRKDLTFVKVVRADAFVVDGQGYSSWDDAVAAINTQGGGTLILNDDVELTGDMVLPSAACTIRSGESGTYSLKGSAVQAQADLTLENLTYNINRLYANGYNLTIGEDVVTPWSFSARTLYAGGVEDISTESVTIEVSSGEFSIYASGIGQTTLTGDVDIRVLGTAKVKLAGAYMSATVAGDVYFSITGDEVSFAEFLGEQSNGQITGELTLKIAGKPMLNTWNPTYQASVNRESFGTLDLTEASEEFDASSFTRFAQVISE